MEKEYRGGEGVQVAEMKYRVWRRSSGCGKEYKGLKCSTGAGEEVEGVEKKYREWRRSTGSGEGVHRVEKEYRG